MLWSHRNAFRSPAEKVTVPAGGHHLGNSATDCSSQLPCVVKILNYLLAKNVLCHMFVVVPSKDVKKMLDFSLQVAILFNAYLIQKSQVYMSFYFFFYFFFI